MLDSVHPKVFKKVGAAWSRRMSITRWRPLQPAWDVLGEPREEVAGAGQGHPATTLEFLLGAARGPEDFRLS